MSTPEKWDIITRKAQRPPALPVLAWPRQGLLTEHD
jgi:hypothetical protein